MLSLRQEPVALICYPRLVLMPTSIADALDEDHQKRHLHLKCLSAVVLHIILPLSTCHSHPSLQPTILNISSPRTRPVDLCSRLTARTHISTETITCRPACLKFDGD